MPGKLQWEAVQQEAVKPGQRPRGKPAKRALKNSFTTNFINPHEILPAEVIAAKVFEALILPKPKVRYTLAPDPMRQVMAALLPKRTLDGIIAKRLGLMPRA